MLPEELTMYQGPWLFCCLPQLGCSWTHASLGPSPCIPWPGDMAESANCPR